MAWGNMKWQRATQDSTEANKKTQDNIKWHRATAKDTVRYTMTEDKKI